MCRNWPRVPSLLGNHTGDSGWETPLGSAGTAPTAQPAPGTGPTSTTGGRKVLRLPQAEVGCLWPSDSGCVRGESRACPGKGGSRPFQPCPRPTASKGGGPLQSALAEGQRAGDHGHLRLLPGPQEHRFPPSGLAGQPALLLLNPLSRLGASSAAFEAQECPWQQVQTPPTSSQ